MAPRSPVRIGRKRQAGPGCVPSHGDAALRPAGQRPMQTQHQLRQRGPDVGPIPVGDEQIVRFGLTRQLTGSGSLEVHSDVEHPIDFVEQSILLQTRFGDPGQQVTVQRTGEVEVDDQPREARMYLPWDAADPTDWACLVPLHGVVLRVKAHAFPLSRLRLVRVTDPSRYLAG